MNFVHEKKQLCIGCGMCSALCKNISLKETEIGHYIACVDKEKCVRCGVCVSVCPVLKSTEEKNKINDELFCANYIVETGYFVNCYEGTSEKHISTSASGGFCTRFLEQLLSCGEVDGVYCAGDGNSFDTLYKYVYVDDINVLKKNSLSAYYPLNLEETIKQILKNDRKVAIVVLPCQATAIRVAMKKNKILAKRIKCIIGLICGGLPGKGMVEFIAKRKGIELTDIKKVAFREKDSKHKCNNCAIGVYTDKEYIKSYFHGDDFGFAYLGNFFHNFACNRCDDIYAESADIVFGDAWFEEYKENIFGTSVCLLRNQHFDEIFKAIDDISVRKIDINRMILAQKNVGLILKKKKNSSIYHRIYCILGYENGKVKCPIKHTFKSMVYQTFLALKKVRKQVVSEKLWKKYKNHEKDFYSLNDKFEKYK